MVVRSFLERVRNSFGVNQTRAVRRAQKTNTTAGAELLEIRQLLTVDFIFQYAGALGSGVGFEDATNGQMRRDALQDAATRLGSMFENNATVTLSVTSSDDPNSGTLASAGSAIVSSNTMFGGMGVVRNKVITGNDLNGGTADGSVNVNWGQPWNISADAAAVGNNEYDFYFVSYHEILHAMGFLSYVSQNGNDVFGTTPGNAGNWAKFDEFITDVNQTRVVDSGGVLNSALWTALSVGGDSASGNGLFFNGPAAMSANNGQPIGLYTPTTWNPGSSVSHIDTTNPAYAGFLMNHAVGTGPQNRMLSDIENGILLDIGYTLADTLSVTEPNGGSLVSDFGRADSFDVSIGIRPTSDVVLNITSQDPGEVAVSVATLTFTPANWRTAQTVDLSGVSDLIADGNQMTNIVISINDAASDAIYSNVQDLIVSVTSIDDDGAIPTKPVITSPTQVPGTSTPVFSWNADANSSRYTLTVINLLTGQQSRRVTDIVAKNYSFALPFPDGLYQANVQAFNTLGQGGPVSDPLIFNIGDPVIPAAPTITSPANAAKVTVSNPTIQWTSVAGATEYELYIVSAGEVITVTTLGADLGNGRRAYTPTQALNEGSASVWVRGINFIGDVGEWSTPVRFTVDAVGLPLVPRITAPLVSTTTNPFPTFEWTSGGPLASTYQLWVAALRDGTGTAQVPAVYDRVIHVIDHNSLNYTHFLPLAEKHYRVWVRAFNSAGETSGWSSPEEFTINIPAPAVPVVDPIPNTEDTTPTFSWKTSGDAYTPGTTFRLWVNNLSTGQARVIDISGLTATSYTPTVALGQGRHAVWVQATNAAGEESAWSERVIVNIDVLPPSRPKVTGPVASANAPSTDILTEFPTFTWTAANNAVRYELWVNHVDSGTSKVIHETDLTTTSFTSTLALPQGNVRVWVRGYNIADEVGEWSAPFTFYLDVPSPSVPKIVAPTPNAVGTVNDATPTIGWQTTVPGATYDLQLQDVVTGVTIVNKTGIVSQTYTIPVNLDERRYQVRVRSLNTVGETSEWSSWYVFTIDVPNATTPIAIGPTGTVTSSNVTFTWLHSTDSVSYEILVRDLRNQENIVIRVDTFDVDSSLGTASFTSALKDGTYRFWVRAFNSQGTASGWSNSLSFIVDDLTVNLEQADSDLEVALVSLTAERPVEKRELQQVDQPAGYAVQQKTESVAREAVQASVESEEVSGPADHAIELLMAETIDPSGVFAMLDRRRS